MTGHDNLLLYLALALGAIALSAAGYLFVDIRKRISGSESSRTRYAETLKSEIASLKREHAHLTETVSRFRAQSLAGISEQINETINKREGELGLSIKESLDDRIKTDLSEANKNFQYAVESINERISRLEKREEPFDARADLQVYAHRLDQLEAAATRTGDLSKSLTESVKNFKVLSAAQVIDRFLSSLEDPEERLKCLLASFDSVGDSATLGKLAVAYPNKNSWIILKELSEHGVVSEVAAWAMIAGGRLTAASGDHKMALTLFQGARHSFITCGGNHDGLWVVNTALAKLSEGLASENYAKDAMANIFALKSNIAQSTAPLQLADFYQREDRLEIATALLLAVCELYIELDLLAYQASIRVVESFGQALLNHYQAKFKTVAAENLFIGLGSNVSALKTLIQRCPSISREAQAGLLVAMLYVARSTRDPGNALFAANPLLALCQPQSLIGSETTAADYAGKIFTLAPSVFDSILVTLDTLELTRKRQSMQILERLTAAFLDTNSLTRASSCGAKLVDCALESYGDASVETVEPISILASIYRRMQRLDLVEECYRQILEIQYKVYSSESEEIVETMLNLSDVCRMQEDVGQAEIFLDSALETAEDLIHASKQTSKLIALVNRGRALKGLASFDDEQRERLLIQQRLDEESRLKAEEEALKQEVKLKEEERAREAEEERLRIEEESRAVEEKLASVEIGDDAQAANEVDSESRSDDGEDSENSEDDSDSEDSAEDSEQSEENDDEDGSEAEQNSDVDSPDDLGEESEGDSDENSGDSGEEQDDKPASENHEVEDSDDLEPATSESASIA